MYYFAYGIHLNKKQMLEICPESKPGFIATLPNYRLVFIGWSRQWRGGTISIRSFRGEKVMGAVYEISDKDLRLLDNYEGYPTNASRLNVTLYNEDGEPVPAITHIRAGNVEETPPSAQYISVIQQGYRDWGLF